ncbi:MAG: Holliday junction branch migration protein RuvA [Patescibacteria group bacterium]
MIGFLSGEVVARDYPYIVINVNGVGYKVLVSGSILSKIILNGKLKLFTHTHVREDAIQLYGFLDSLDLKLFENLISVSGIGPKTAMNIFSVGTREEIVHAIITGDVTFFVGVPRLGRKNAQKVIIELKSRLGSIGDLDLSKIDNKEISEVVTALKNFGFNNREALEALKNIKGEGRSTEEQIRMALKEMGK